MENADDQASISKGSQEFFETVCEPCNESDNVHVKAEGYCVTCKEYICKSCIQSHKRMKLLKDHQIQGLDEMLETTPSQETEESVTSFKEEIKVECKEHKGENIRYFCKNHKVVGCVDCVTLTHRSCEDVKKVPDASTEPSVATELEEFYQRLKSIAEGVQNLIQMAEKNHLQVEDQMVKLLQDIGKYKETIIETFNNLANEIETKLRSKISEDKGKLDQLVKRSKALQINVEQTSNEFENLQRFKQKNTEFIRMNQSQLQLAEWEKEWNELNAITKPNQYGFCPDMELRYAMKKVSELGQLVERNDTELCTNCMTISPKTHIQDYKCGHVICTVCKDGLMLKDVTSSVCVECTSYCKICKTAVDKSTTSDLACGHCVCLPCKEKEDMAPCTDCGLITVQCKSCKAFVDKTNTTVLACGHSVCLTCKKMAEMIKCSSCSLITVHCKRCNAGVDDSTTSVLACGHHVCLPCRKQRRVDPCTDCGLITGNQPSGSMDESSAEEYDAPIEVLEFSFPDGIQAPFYPNPGKPYKGGTLAFRLRKCDRYIYNMLKIAFGQNLICRIDRGKIKSNFKQYNGNIVNPWHAEGFSFNRAPTDEYEEYIGNLKDRLKEFGIQS